MTKRNGKETYLLNFTPVLERRVFVYTGI